MLEKGTILGGYRIEGLIGQGGMGVVYTATQLSLDRTVALKVLAGHLSKDEGFRERFRREGLIQAAIDHPHIVTVYEAGESQEGLFLAMRLIKGPNLRDLILGREVDAERAVHILRQVADALDTAHEAGLVHRDIKPQNVLVSLRPRDHAYLADFGVTKALGRGSLTRTGQLVGTLDYISPEQIRGKGASTRSDIYAFAAVLYECLTGTVPYPRDSDAAVLYAHLADPPPRVTDTRPELPDALSLLIQRAMAKEPETRHATAGELMTDVERAFGDGKRAILTVPGPIKTPAEAGIRKSEEELHRARATPTTPATPAPASPSGTVIAGTPPLAPAGAMTVDAATPAQPVSQPTPWTMRIKPLRDRRAAAALLAVAFVGLAALGFSVARASSDGQEEDVAAPTTIDAGNVTLIAPAGWTRAAAVPSVAGIEFTDPVALEPPAEANAGVVAGAVTAEPPGFLPEGLRLGGKSPDAELVRIGTLEAFRYTGLQTTGFARALVLYVLPQAEGTTAIACFAPQARATAFLPECESVAASLRVAGAKLYPLAPAKAYATAFNSAINRLRAAQARGLTRLRGAKTSKAQADAATALANAYAAAASSLRRAKPTPLIQPVNTSIVAAVRRVARAYGQLTQAAQAEDAKKYEAARRAVTAEGRGLDRELARLSQFGYRF